jgi:hypothetical protein
MRVNGNVAGILPRRGSMKAQSAIVIASSLLACQGDAHDRGHATARLDVAVFATEEGCRLSLSNPQPVIATATRGTTIEVLDRFYVHQLPCLRVRLASGVVGYVAPTVQNLDCKLERHTTCVP